MLRSIFHAAVVLVLASTLVTTRALALDAFEIQVYEAEVNRPGQFGLELHSNASIQGHATPEYPEQIPPNHVARFTLEPALGITEWLELGAYLQTMITPHGGKFGGAKLRAKFVLPERFCKPFFFGINAEVGRVPRTVEAEGWANEFRPIIGWSNGRFLVDVNPIFGYALSGPQRFRPDFEPAGKVAVNTDRGFMLGVEYYAGLGLVTSGFSPWRDQEHLVFATFDLVEPVGQPEGQGANPWELNLGVGRSLTEGTPSRWLVKAIVGRAF
jgi:hypothetical protein